MANVIGGMTLSLDGYINDRSGSVSDLYPNLDDLRDSPIMQEWITATGAAIMGRRTYDMANGDFTGYEFQVPIFVLTHQPPPTPAKGQNENLSFTFVTGGIAEAIERAKAAAGAKNVVIVGGASVTQQALNAGLVDEVQTGIMPVLLGGGLRLFDGINAPLYLEKYRIVESVGGRTDIFYRVRR